MRHNFVALGLDFALFMVGLSFTSQTTILPAFAEHLRAPNLVIGAIPAVMTVGWFLPSLFVAAHTERLPRMLPFVLRWTVWERAPLLVLAGAAFLLAERAPAATLAVTLVMLVLMTGVGGVLMPAWMELIARTIPLDLRGRFFASASTAGNVGGLAGGLVTSCLLAAVRPPINYGLCFLGAAAWMALSYLALTQTREPPGRAPKPAVAVRTYLGRVPGLLRRDANFSWYLLARSLGVLGTMANGFFTIYALRAYDAQSWQVGLFTALLLGGQIPGNLILGWAADRVGHRPVIMVGVGATAAASAVALGATSLSTFAGVFLLVGIHLAAVNVSSLSVLLEFSPTPGERPTYVGLGNTAVAPVAFLAPLAAGLLVDTLGFGWVFAVSVVSAMLALGVLAGQVRDPRSVPAR